MKFYCLILVSIVIHSLHTQTPVVLINPSLDAYYGIENAVYVTNTKQAFHLQATDTTYCKVRKQTDHWTLMPIKVANDTGCTLLVLSKENKILNVVKTRNMELSMVRVKLGEHADYITKAELMALDSLTLGYPYNNLNNNDYQITRFHMIFIPRRSFMMDINSSVNHFGPSVKDIFEKCQPGDILVFEGIRAKSKKVNIEKQLHPIIYYIVKPESPGTYTPRTIEGYVITPQGIRKPFWFPKSVMDTASPHGCIKDSLWIYRYYDERLGKYEAMESELYDSGVLIESSVYDLDERIEYAYSRINDSMVHFKYFHKNGVVMQEGECRLNTKFTSIRNFRLLMNYKDTLKYPEFHYLSYLPSDYHPLGFWNVYDTSGTKIFTFEYEMVLDPSWYDGPDPREYDINYVEPRFYYLDARKVYKR